MLAVITAWRRIRASASKANMPISPATKPADCLPNQSRRARHWNVRYNQLAPTLHFEIYSHHSSGVGKGRPAKLEHQIVETKRKIGKIL